MSHWVGPPQGGAPLSTPGRARVPAAAARKPPPAAEAPPGPAWDFDAAWRPFAEPARGPAAGDGPAPPSSDELRVGFAADLDGDGAREQHSLLVEGQGEGARLMLRSEPVLLEEFLKGRSGLSAVLKADVDAAIKLSKKAISQSIGDQIRRLLHRIAGVLGNNQHGLPSTTVTTWQTTSISYKNVQETVTNRLHVEPLSLRPGDGRLTGSGVQNSSTPLMKELRKWAPYVRGHMLNAKVHGPGIDDNLVPISRDMNKKMELAVEERLKKLVNAEGRVVSYEVVPRDWGQYPGSGKGAAVEKILPKRFKMRIRPMRKTSILVDGTQAAHWEIDPNAREERFDRDHDVPNKTTFNLDAAPVELGLGVYDINESMYENPNHPGRWVFDGQVIKHSVFGKVKTEEYKVPKVVAASPPKTLTARGQRLIVSEPAADLKTLDGRIKALQSTDGHIARNHGEAVNAAQQAEGAVARLKAAAGDAESAELEQRLGEELGKLKSLLDEWMAFARDAEDFWNGQKGKLGTDEAGFWADQDKRDEMLEKTQDQSSKQALERGAAHQELERITRRAASCQRAAAYATPAREEPTPMIEEKEPAQAPQGMEATALADLDILWEEDDSIVLPEDDQLLVETEDTQARDRLRELLRKGLTRRRERGAISREWMRAKAERWIDRVLEHRDNQDLAGKDLERIAGSSTSTWSGNRGCVRGVIGTGTGTETGSVTAALHVRTGRSRGILSAQRSSGARSAIRRTSPRPSA